MSSMIKTKIKDFTLRFAEEKDVPQILCFIRELAEYEMLLDEVVATEGSLKESLFDRKMAEVIIGDFEGMPVGFALFFHNYSTFLGKPGIYLEDLYVKADMRGKGLGKVMLSYLGNLAIERNCGRLEWWCLDWNRSSINFYEQLGAKAMKDWTVYRVCDEELSQLAAKFNMTEL